MKSNRRNFIKNSSVLLAGVLLLEDTKALVANNMASHTATNSNSGAGLRVRKSVNSLKPTDPDIVLYRKAVEVMKARPAGDANSWDAQARIHADFCSHQNWFFLPWHRAYLKYFEELCREACGDPSFNLPYWDWTRYPQVPAPFWGANNALNNSTRKITAKSVAPSEMVGASVIKKILEIESFEDFASYRSISPMEPGGTGRLEGAPHNAIHRFIGGNMGTFLSPLDPIFWLHHANVDRIWAMWNESGKKNPDDDPFRDFIFAQNFYDSASSAKVDVRVGDMFDVRAVGYIYDTQQDKAGPTVMNINSTFRLLANTKTSVTNTLAATKFKPMKFGLVSSKVLADGITDLIEKGMTLKNDKAIKVIIGDIPPPQDEEFYVRVFVNCDYLDKDTPLNDPHYAGSFTFFASNHGAHGGHGHSGHDHGSMTAKTLKFVLDITETLEKVSDVGTIDTIKDKINIQLLTVPLGTASPATIVPGKIEIVVAEKVG